MPEVRRLFARGNSEERERHSLAEKIGSVRSALHLAGVHRIKKCGPFLREWEEFDVPSYSTGSTAMRDWWLEVQHFRPILHHSLRLLGEEPHGFPASHFVKDGQRFSAPERLADRQARTSQVSQSISAEEVLRLLGSPDHITRDSHKVDNSYHWTEAWEYDF